MATAPIGFVIASQSDTLARGVCEVVSALAPDVAMRPCGCHDEGLARAIELLADACSHVASQIGDGHHVVILADAGPVKLAAHQLINQWGEGQVTLAHGPFFEGTMAGVRSAQQREPLAQVLRDIAGALGPIDAPASVPTSDVAGEDPYAPRVVTVVDEDGLKARPAAVLARLASDYDAHVSVNGVDASSVLALMGLRIRCGDEIRLEATGPESRMALEALAAAISSGLTGAPTPK